MSMNQALQIRPHLTNVPQSISLTIMYRRRRFGQTLQTGEGKIEGTRENGPHNY
uniref:Uncharacterized protein n=1 Tax=Arundo donax TaxID=35708 RepID=A0A0A9ASG1_ARUDO